MLVVKLFDLSRNTSLRSLRLTLEEIETAMDWATTFLSSIDSSTTLERVALEFYVDVKRLERWQNLDVLLSDPGIAPNLRQVEVGLFASPSSSDFQRTEEALGGVKERAELRLYQLGLKSQRSSRQLSPRISRYEG